MAFGKNSRTDIRRSSSSYCSTATLIVFVALCLVGVWMMTSSAVVPGEPVDLNQENRVEVREEPQVTTDTKQFEDSPGDLPEDAIRGDVGGGSVQDEVKDEIKKNPPEEIYEKPSEEKKEEAYVKENGDGNGGSDDTGENQVENEGEGKKTDGGEEKKSEEGSSETLGDVNEQQSQNEKEENNGEGEKEQGGLEEKVDGGENKESNGENKEQSQNENTQNEDNKEQFKNDQKEQSQNEEKKEDPSPAEIFPDGAQAEILNETNVQSGEWKTQAKESKEEKEVQELKGHIANEGGKDGNSYGYSWKLCNVTAGADFIPCLDNEEAIKKLRSTKHYEHRERHCPEQGPTCLVPLPQGYKKPIAWPTSKDKIWYHNVPHTKLAELKGHQNWVRFSGEYLIFPGGGTQFKHGALHYIDFIQESVPDIAWGKRSRVVLDVGCGVASFGGFLFDRDVLTMSFAPKDEHEAQVQFALERGIPAISAVMGTQRLPFPARVFDIVHCARCRVPWHIEGGKLLLELNRVLRPGGYFVWSATPVYQKLEEDVGIWNAMKALTKSMCWDLVTIKKDTVNRVGAAIYRKPSSNECYEKRAVNNPPLCVESEDPNAAWYVPLQTCMHRVPVDPAERGSNWPEQWPQRVEKPPYWLNHSQVGVYGKAAPDDFLADYEHWKRVVSKSYLNGLGISWSDVRNVMDMRSIYGGFAAALKDMNVWVMNVVTVDSPDTLPIIYERGMFGIYHDWCESFNTYPRTYDLLHADHLFSKVKKRCALVPVMVEVDRILRPEGKLIVRDNVETISELENLAKSLHWDVRLTYSKDKEGLLCVQKTAWRPSEVDTSMSSTA